MKYYKLTILFSFIMILLTSNIASAAFAEGDIYTFSIIQTQSTETKQLNDGDPGKIDKFNLEYEINFEILDINDKDEELTYQFTLGNLYYNSQNLINETISINATDVGYNTFDIYAGYSTRDTGKEYINRVNLNLGFDIFVNPDWKEFNQGVSDAIDKDRSLIFVANKTIDDLFDEAVSFEIMGEKTIVDARDKLDTDKKLKYEFVFDFSDAVTYVYYDTKDGEYKYDDYNVYELAIVVEYDKDGVLSNAKYTKKTEVTTDYATITYDYVMKISSGGLSGFIASVPGFEFPLVMLAVAIPILIKKYRK